MATHHRLALLLWVGIILLNGIGWCADPAPKRVLLLAQKPDSHPPTTHEYLAGQRILAALLERQSGLQVLLVQADSPWTEGPEFLEHADAVVLYLTEGAKWIHSDAERLAAFQKLAERKGGLSCLHWAMGSRETAPVAEFAELFGACHGGPDRKYKVGEFQISRSVATHPILTGIEPLSVHDEFYFALKFAREKKGLIPLLRVDVEHVDPTVAWSWERPDGGRSFGFSGLHFHENWRLAEYRRLIVQGILWTLDLPIPATGVDVEIPDSVLQLRDASAK